MKYSRAIHEEYSMGNRAYRNDAHAGVRQHLLHTVAIKNIYGTLCIFKE